MSALRIRLKRWPFWLRWLPWVKPKTQSTTMPWGTVYLRDTAFPVDFDRPSTRVLIEHERVHVSQMSEHPGWVLGAWIWAVRYLLSAKFRIEVEIPAEGYEAFVRAELLGEDVVPHHVSHGLRPGGTYRLPEWADKDEISQRVFEHAQRLQDCHRMMQAALRSMNGV